MVSVGGFIYCAHLFVIPSLSRDLIEAERLRFEKRFFDSAVATLRMTKAREIVRTRMDSVGLEKKQKDTGHYF